MSKRIRIMSTSRWVVEITLGIIAMLFRIAFLSICAYFLYLFTTSVFFSHS